ncbi:MAG: PstS family phosphate ABC transporter substrate-binding protein [Verrucomicrobiota bacterium]|jgi:phosphate transport system substrate-binding protein
MRNVIKFALVAGTVLASSAALAGNITVKGSDTLVILAQKWAETYMKSHADVKIQVTGGGSGVGFAALQNKTTDLADASRPIKPKEIEACIRAFGKRPTEYKVAMDGLSIFVNEDNPLTELSLEDLAGIFGGQIKNWKEVGGSDSPIVAYSRENSSGTYEFFKEHVLKGKDFSAGAQTLQGTAQVIQAVAGEKRGIGYGGAAYAKGVRILKVSKDKGGPAIEPNEENVLSNTYPISRFLFVYINPALDKGEIAAYLNWIRSDDGQKIVKDVGYYPLPPQYRQK